MTTSGPGSPTTRCSRSSRALLGVVWGAGSRGACNGIEPELSAWGIVRFRPVARADPEARWTGVAMRHLVYAGFMVNVWPARDLFVPNKAYVAMPSLLACVVPALGAR